MPFTPAHSAIVLPFLKKRAFSATGLIIGSIAPDFEYFLRMNETSEHSHTVAGIFYFNLPVAVFLAFVFHHLVKQNLILNLPLYIQLRFQETLQLNFKNYFRNNYYKFALSVILGSLSHIFWDAFTHLNGFFAQNLWFYEGSYVPFDGVNYPLWYALQHISTYCGLFILILYIVFKPVNRMTRIFSNYVAYWTVVLLITGLVVWLRFAIAPHDYTLGNLVIAIITGCCAGLICGGLLPVSKSIPEAQ